MKELTLPALVLAAAMASVPAWAQTKPPNPAPQQQAAGENAHMGIATVKPTGIAPSKRNPLLTDSGDVRIGKLIGSDVYNKNDKKVGGVDGVVASRSGQLQIVIATNRKKVAVPWNKVEFGDAKLNSDNKVLMPDETQQSLNSMPTFHYTNPKGR